MLPNLRPNLHNEHALTSSLTTRYTTLQSIFWVFGFLVLAFFWITAILAAFQHKLFLGGDSEIFASSSFLAARLNVVSNPFYDPLMDNPDHLLLWHGWFMPWLQSHFLEHANYPAFLYSCLVISLATLGIYTILVRRSWSLGLVLIVSVVLYYQWGRPELVVSLVVGLYLIPGVRAARSSICDGMLLAVVFCTSPTAFVTLTLLWMVYHTGLNSLISNLQFWTKAFAVCGLFVVAATTLVAGINVVDWARGLLEHSAVISARPFSGSYLHYYLLAPEFPGLALYVAFAFLALASFASKVPFYGQVLLVTLCFWLLSRLISPHAVYNIIFLIPIAFYAFCASNCGACYRKLEENARRGLNAIYLVALVLTSASLLRGALLHVDLISKGMSADEMRRLVFEGHDFGQLQTNSLSILMNLKYGGDVRGRDVTYSRVFDEKISFIVPQAFSGRVGPARVECSSCEVRDYFHRDVPTFAKIRVGRTRKDWSFVLVVVHQHVER